MDGSSMIRGDLCEYPSGCKNLIEKAGIDKRNLCTWNQQSERNRFVWDRKTGKPVYNAVVWQCKRSEDLQKIAAEYENAEELVRSHTGLQFISPGIFQQQRSPGSSRMCREHRKRQTEANSAVNDL